MVIQRAVMILRWEAIDHPATFIRMTIGNQNKSEEYLKTLNSAQPEQFTVHRSSIIFLSGHFAT